MAIDINAYQKIQSNLAEQQVCLVAVSKTKPKEDIEALYALGQRDFGENYVQELLEKQPQLPDDIRWHFIGHLQTNKVKYIVPIVHLIHGVDSYKLLVEINKQAQKLEKIVECLLQVYIASEETKFGFDAIELADLFQADLSALTHIKIVGLMGMASFTTDESVIRKEFVTLKKHYELFASKTAFNIQFHTLSMGMSSDYWIAIEEGSTMVRIGSLLFGKR